MSLTNASYSVGGRPISVSMSALFAALVLSVALSPQPVSKGRKTGAVQQQNKTRGNANERTQSQKSAEPTRVTLDGPVTVINQPDSKQEQRDAEQKAQARFANGVQLATLIFAAFAAWAAYRAYRANRSADTSEQAITLLQGQMAEERQRAVDALAATRAAADAAQTTADALKVIHRQWVSIADWRIVIDRMPKSPGKWWLSVGITIVNSSPLPLTVIAVRMKINSSRTGVASWHSVEPSGRFHESIHHVLSDEDASAFLANTPLSFTIEGWVHFTDAFGDIQSQQIGTFCQISRATVAQLRGLAGLAKSLAQLEKEWPFRPEDYEILTEANDHPQQQ